MSCRTHGKHDGVCRHQALGPAVTILYTRRCHAPPLRRQPHHRAQLQAAAGMLGLLQQSLGKQLGVHLQGRPARRGAGGARRMCCTAVEKQRARAMLLAEQCGELAARLPGEIGQQSSDWAPATPGPSGCTLWRAENHHLPGLSEHPALNPLAPHLCGVLFCADHSGLPDVVAVHPLWQGWQALLGRAGRRGAALPCRMCGQSSRGAGQVCTGGRRAPPGSC